MGWRSVLYGRIHRREIRHMEAGFEDPAAAQESFLRSVMSHNALSDFGRRYGFSGAGTVGEFRKRVPLSSYENYRADVERLARGEKHLLTQEDLLFFALTSGTTGPEKLIPMTPSLERDMARAQVYWNARLVADDDAYGRWKYLVLVSSPEERQSEAGIPCRSVSSRILVGGAGHVFRVRPLYRAAVAVPGQVFQVHDAQARLHLVALSALSSRLGSVTAANPSTVVHFCRFLHENRAALVEDLARGRVRTDVRRLVSKEEWAQVGPLFSAMRPDRKRAGALGEILSEDPFSLQDVWPGLELVNCWLGGTLSLYLRRLRQYSRGIPLRDVGYRASEGFFSIPLENEASSGALHVTGNFFEFAEENAPGREPLLLQDLEPGGRYRLIITQSGGLYRYDMEDIIEVTGTYRKTPLVRFLHKTGEVLSLTGEKLSGLQAVSVVNRLQRDLGLSRLDFLLTHTLDIPPSYVFLFEAGGEDAERLRKRSNLACDLDSALAEENIEYRSKRTSGRLGPACASLLVPGTLEALRAGRGRLHPYDAQNKPSHLLGEGEDRDWLLTRIAWRLAGEGTGDPPGGLDRR